MLLFFVLFDSKERKENDGKVYIAFIDSKAIFERFLKFGKKGDENFGRKRTRGRNNKNKEKEFKKEFKNLRRNEDNGYNEERDEQCFWNEDRYWIEVCDESNI